MTGLTIGSWLIIGYAAGIASAAVLLIHVHASIRRQAWKEGHDG